MNLKNLKYIFYCNIDNKVLYLQAILNKYFLNETILADKYKLSVREMDYNSQADLEEWCDVINNSYDDCNYNKDSALTLLTNHLFLDDTKTYLFYKQEDDVSEISKNLPPYYTQSHGILCATISVGTYKDNEKVGGIFRIGCKNKFWGNHYGNAIVLYALSQLQARGFKLCEDVVSAKREVSLQMHMTLGFEPQFDWHYVTFKKNLKNVNFIQKIRLRLRLKGAYEKHTKMVQTRFKI